MEWIKVSDRLPDKYEGDKVVLIDNKHIKIAWYQNWNKIWWTGAASYTNQVTHWMSLPNPPKTT